MTMNDEMVPILTSPGALLVLLALAQGDISEGQSAQVLGVDRVAVRELLAEATRVGKASTETAQAFIRAGGTRGRR